MCQYDHLERDTLVRLLERRAAERNATLQTDGAFGVDRLRW